MSNVPNKACWKADDAKVILATEATEGGDEIFLATHFPVTDFEIQGTRSSDVGSATEHGLLDALSSPTTNHAFCVVEGEPGSGKSHLIRWLHIKWPAEEDLKILIQRADGSLGGTLHQLQQKLPPEHQHLFDFVGRPQDITLTGRTRLFHTNLALSLKGDFFEKPPQDAEWCDKYNLSEILGRQELLGAWSGPERILNILSGKKGERNQELARFNLDDIVELSQLLRPLSGKSLKAVKFERLLQKDVEALQLLSREDKLDPAKHEQLSKDFQTSYKLMEALNLRRNSAIQNSLGISSEGLKELFMRLRRELKNRRLVLLLEDITAWEGVDNQLVDVLVTNAETREDKDLCPMISVVGITPLYFHDASFHTNYKQRITHHIKLGKDSVNSQYQDVSSLRTPQSQVSFAATYLRAIRAGVEALTNRDDNTDPVPNVCNNCVYKKDCHATFGEHEDIGLYPFNERAITTLYNALEDPAHEATFQTPRGMLQGVLAPTLSHTSVLDEGGYPGAEIETSWVSEDKKLLGAYASGILKVKASSEREFHRLRRTVSYWGTEGAAQVQKTDSGLATFFQIPEGVYQAFRLPWPGGSYTEHQAPTPTDQQPTPIVETVTPTSPQHPSPPGIPLTGTGEETTPSGLPAELREVRNDLAAWMAERQPENPSNLNRLAYEVLQGLPWQHVGISDWVKDKLFTQDTVILQGTKKERIQHFVILREAWVQAGIEAFQALKKFRNELKDWEEEAYQRQYAAMVRNLRKSVIAHTQQRLFSSSDAKTWSITGIAGQVLNARAWLRGLSSPNASPWLQWRALLNDEGVPTTNPQDRVDIWGEAVTKTNGSHGKIREMLRRWVAINQGDGSTAPGDVPQAIAALKETFKLSTFPVEVPTAATQLAELSLLVSAAEEVNQRLSNIPNNEKDRLIGLAQAIDTKLRYSTIREHLGRVNEIVQYIGAELPSAAPLEVSTWANTYQRLVTLGYTSPGVNKVGKKVEDFIDSISDDSREPVDNLALTLEWTMSSPASEIKIIHESLTRGETTIQALLRYVEQYLNDSGTGSGDLETLHGIGQSLSAVCASILNSLKEETNE